MSINKTRIKRLERLLFEAERESSEICKSRGLKGSQESRVYEMHNRILKANAAFKEVRASVERKELRKARSKRETFKPDELDPNKL